MIRIIGLNPHIGAMFSGDSLKEDGKSFCFFSEKSGQVLEHGAKIKDVFKRYKSDRSFKLSSSIFIEAREYFHANFNKREDISPILDSNGNTVGYLYFVRNRLRDNSIYQGIPAVDFWDYDFENKYVNEFVLNWASDYVFSQLEEYTYAIAKYILHKFPDSKVYFLDSMANLDIWGVEHKRVKVISSIYDIPEDCRRNCMQITTSEYNAYNDYAPESKNLIYNSVNIMYSMQWGKSISHPGNKYPNKVVVRLDNNFATAGLVDIIKVIMNYAYQAEMQGYLPVVDLSMPGCCQYWEPGVNVWEELFRPLSNITIQEAKDCANLVSARKEERGWLVSDWRSNPLWREADYRALATDRWCNQPYLSDKAYDFVMKHAPDHLKSRIEKIANMDDGSEDEKTPFSDNFRILGVIIRGTDYRKEANKSNEKNANNANVKQVLGWTKNLMRMGGYDYIFLATEDEEYFRLFKESFSVDKLLYVDQPRVSLDLSLGRMISTDVLFKEKKVAGLELAKLYLTVLKCLAVCDDLISSMDNGTYRQAMRWNAGRYGMASVVKDVGILAVSQPKNDVKTAIQEKPKINVPKEEPKKEIVVDAVSRKISLPAGKIATPKLLFSERRRALWVEERITRIRKPEYLRKGDFFIVDDLSYCGGFIYGSPICSPDTLIHLVEKPLVLLLQKNAENARKKLLAFGYKEGKDFISQYDMMVEEKEIEKAIEPSVSKPVTPIVIKTKPQIKLSKHDNPYDEYLRNYGQVTEMDRLEMIRDISGFKYKPLISIIMPVFNPQEKFFRMALDSVRNQVYQHWELCIADDASSNSYVRNVIEEYCKKDIRIKVTYRKENGHICKAENSALELAFGEFTALMDHDDILQPEALYCVVKEINEVQGEVDMLFTDMDYIDGEGHRSNPRFGADFDPVIFAAWNNVSHLDVYRTSIMRKIGGFRPGYEGSQDHDMTFRFMRQTTPERVCHIPRVCYSWRRFVGYETASSDAGFSKSCDASYRAVKDYYAENNNLEVSRKGHIQVKPKLPVPAPLVSIIIPTKDKVNILKDCVESILSVTEYPAYEIIIIDNGSEEQETKKYFKTLRKNKKVHVYPYPYPFNHSSICNFGVKKSKGDCYLFLNNDTKMMESGWLTSMVRELMREKVGIVGAKLLYGNNKIQHAGVALRGAFIAHHPGMGLNRDAYGWRQILKLTHQCSAVTGACMLMRKEAFDTVGGWDEKNVPESYNDVDICLRVRKAGWQIVYDAEAVLYHLESISRGYSWDKPKDIARHEMERKARHVMIKRYEKELFHDPFYNPNLTWERPDYSIAKFPAVGKPWRPWMEFVCPFPLGEVLLGIQVACQAYRQGHKLRMHVASEYVYWLSDFQLPFPVLPLPMSVPVDGKSEEVYTKACEYVASLPDSSGHIVGTSPNKSFERSHRLNIVEYLMCQLQVPIGEKITPVLPLTRNLDKVTESMLDTRIALIQIEGDQKQSSMPREVVLQMVEMLHSEGFNIVQIGLHEQERIEGIDNYLIAEATVGGWRAIFEKASLIVSADSWVSQYASMMGIPQITLFKGSAKQDYYTRQYFCTDESNSIAVEMDSYDEKILRDMCHVL